MLNIIALSAIGFIVLVISALLVIGINLDKMLPEKLIQEKDKKKKVEEVEEDKFFFDEHFFQLPSGVESISKNEIQRISQYMIDVYKNLKYKENSSDFLKKNWHTWQISMMLKVYKYGLPLRVNGAKEIFPKELFERSDEDLKKLMNNVIARYKSEVKIKAQRELLINELEWTGKEMGIILLFLSRYRDFDEGV